MKLKLLAATLCVIPFILVGVWWWSAGAQADALEGWMAERRAAGWQAEVAEIDVNGFPSRLDATLRAPALADPVSGWAWSADRLDIRQVIYDPTFFTVHWPAEQRIAAPGAPATLRVDVMEASLRVDGPSALGVERVSFDVQRGAVAADAGWTASVDRFTQHIRRAANAGPENAYEFRLDARLLRLPEFVRRYADPAGALPAAIELVAIEGRAALDRPLDRAAFEGAKPQILALSLAQAEAKWGGLALALDGAVKADEDGYAEGEIDLSAQNWKEMLEGAVSAGVVGRGLADALETGLGFVARLGGDPDRLDATINFSGGFMKIGPVPVGPAPRLVGG